MSATKSQQRPAELLSPAGDWECARAAVANGADAIYFGLPAFNARMRAENFTEEDLPELMAFLHEHGVRGFVTMNVLIFQSELPQAVAQLRALDAAGVDAVIIQDIGLARLAKAVAPNVELHASTQMTITSPEGLALIDDSIGLDLAVLARETSIKEMRLFKATQAGSVPLEVFVHGALCVAYSGQCLTSESLGQRSANRGECAQACRMEYELIVDGEKRDLGQQAYLLSPQDLAAVDEIADLIGAGISSFKIEGRLKSPDYVAAVTKAYRKAIDAVLADQPISEAVLPEDRYAMEMTFSRGLHTGWMHGIDNKQLVHGRFGKKRGALVGEVTRVGKDFVEVTPQVEVKPGDGVVFDSGSDTNREQGGSLYAVRDAKGGVRLQFGNDKIRFAEINTGDRIWKTADPALTKALKATYSGRIKKRSRDGLRLRIRGAAGEPLRVESLDHGVEVCTDSVLERAEKRPLDDAILIKQFGRLGETAFELEEVINELTGELMMPPSALNRARRALVDKLEQGRADPVRLPATGSLEKISDVMDWGSGAPEAACELSVLCRTEEQITAALEAGVAFILVDFEDIRRGKDAVAQVREYSGTSKVILAMPRIQKPGEAGFFKVVERAEPDGVLIRNLGGVAHFKERDDLLRFGDFSLNVANTLSADHFLSLGLDRLTISYDLAIHQVLDFVSAAPNASALELTLHQHMPMFHMEHCVFCSFMSEGTDVTNCGRPCDTHDVQLRDRVGMLHPLKADVGCRNTLFNGKAQTGAKFFATLRDAGLRHYRVEFLDEDQAAAAETLTAYQSLLSGQAGGEELWRELRASSKLGVTVGTMES